MVKVFSDEKEAREFARKIAELVERYVNEQNIAMREMIMDEIKRSIVNLGVGFIEEVGRELASQGRAEVEDLFGIKFGENLIEEQVLRDYFSNEHWQDILNNYGKLIGEKVKEVIDNNIVRLGDGRVKIDYGGLMEDLQNVVGLAYNEAERIARSELHSIYNSALVKGYEFLERGTDMKLRYKWVNPLDNRTSEICREIISRVGNGVGNLGELEKIVEEVSMKHLGKYGWRYRKGSWIAHPNCRSRVLAVRVKD